MLKKMNRITKKKEFDHIFKNGKSIFNKIIGMKIVFNELDNSRFGIIVSNKISKKAVKRNKIKRQIRSILRKKLEILNKNIDCTVIALPKLLTQILNQ